MLEHLVRSSVLRCYCSDNQMNRDNQQERLSNQKHLPNIVWYIVGFVDGEGSFNISFRKNREYNIRWQPVLSFNVSQRERTMLDLIKQYFQCGIVKKRADGLHSYDVTNPTALWEKIIPFFDQHRFISETKRHNYLLFKQAVELMYKREHLQSEGLQRLVAIREKINVGAGRTRKYSASDILVESSETIR